MEDEEEIYNIWGDLIRGVGADSLPDSRMFVWIRISKMRAQGGKDFVYCWTIIFRFLFMCDQIGCDAILLYIPQYEYCAI